MVATTSIDLPNRLTKKDILELLTMKDSLELDFVKLMLYCIVDIPYRKLKNMTN